MKVEVKKFGGKMGRGEKVFLIFLPLAPKHWPPRIKTFHWPASIGTFHWPPIIGTFHWPPRIGHQELEPYIGHQSLEPSIDHQVGIFLHLFIFPSL
jgi:hypothetical protein